MAYACRRGVRLEDAGGARAWRASPGKSGRRGGRVAVSAGWTDSGHAHRRGRQSTRWRSAGGAYRGVCSNGRNSRRRRAAAALGPCLVSFRWWGVCPSMSRPASAVTPAVTRSHRVQLPRSVPGSTEARPHGPAPAAARCVEGQQPEQGDGRHTGIDAVRSARAPRSRRPSTVVVEPVCRRRAFRVLRVRSGQGHGSVQPRRPIRRPDSLSVARRRAVSSATAAKTVGWVGRSVRRAACRGEHATCRGCSGRRAVPTDWRIGRPPRQRLGRRRDARLRAPEPEGPASVSPAPEGPAGTGPGNQARTRAPGPPPVSGTSSLPRGTHRLEDFVWIRTDDARPTTATAPARRSRYMPSLARAAGRLPEHHGGGRTSRLRTAVRLGAGVRRVQPRPGTETPQVRRTRAAFPAAAS